MCVCNRFLYYYYYYYFSILIYMIMMITLIMIIIMVIIITIIVMIMIKEKKVNYHKNIHLIKIQHFLISFLNEGIDSASFASCEG